MRGAGLVVENAISAGSWNTHIQVPAKPNAP
jgi:hypothetical protein